VQCGRSVRDPTGTVALAAMNQAGRPSGLGMDAEASHPPSHGKSAGGGEREENGANGSDFG